MITKIAEYTIKEGELDAVRQCIATFVAAIHENEPETFYEAYQRGDTLGFIHLMKFPTPEAEKQHQQASYTLEFVAELYPRCSLEPQFTELTSS